MRMRTGIAYPARVTGRTEPTMAKAIIEIGVLFAGLKACASTVARPDSEARTVAPFAAADQTSPLQRQRRPPKNRGGCYKVKTAIRACT